MITEAPTSSAAKAAPISHRLRPRCASSSPSGWAPSNPASTSCACGRSAPTTSRPASPTRYLGARHRHRQHPRTKPILTTGKPS